MGRPLFLQFHLLGRTPPHNEVKDKRDHRKDDEQVNGKAGSLKGDQTYDVGNEENDSEDQKHELACFQTK